MLATIASHAATRLEGGHWSATWAAAPQYASANEMPAGSGLNDCALRQIIHVSAGGDAVRLRLSNRHSAEPVVIRSVYIADAGEMERIDVKTARFLTFNKRYALVLEKGAEVTSDAVKFNLKPLQRLAITINYASSPKEGTAHLGSRTTSYIIKGVAKPKSDFTKAERIDHWYNISALEVYGPQKDVIAVLGNSITDGRGSTTNMQNRWTDVFAEQLHRFDPHKAVLNLGIGGNCVLRGGLGEPALKRYRADILEQTGVKKVILFEGINDIGGSKGNSEQVAEELIKALQSMAEEGRRHGLKVYGATITPIKHSQYFSYFHDAARQTVNDWIRTAKCFDGVLDFDRLMRDPSDPQALRKDLQDDWLHPNAQGYKVMGEYAAEVMK